MNEHKTKTVMVVQVSQYDAAFPPENADNFVQWVNQKISEIPEQYMSSAKVEIGAEDSYGSYHATIEISYRRPETDEEMQARIYAQESFAEQRRSRELRQLAELKAKYEGEQQ